jgi:hypothetical protein
VGTYVTEQLQVQTREEELEAQIERLRIDNEEWQLQNKALLRQLNKARNEIKKQRSSGPYTETVRRLFERWLRKTKRKEGRTRLTDDRFDAVANRLKEGYEEDAIGFAIDLLPHTAYVDDKGKVHDDLALVCRSGSKLEDFIERGERKMKGPLPQVDDRFRQRGLDYLYEPCDCSHLRIEHSHSAPPHGFQGCLSPGCECIDYDTIGQQVAAFVERERAA